MSYDSGKPQGTEHIRAGLFNVESFREPGKVYRVDVHRGTCTCMDYQTRHRTCKHQRLCSEILFREAAQKAMPLATADLERHARRTDLPEITLRAIRSVLKFRETCEMVKHLDLAA